MSRYSVCIIDKETNEIQEVDLDVVAIVGLDNVEVSEEGINTDIFVNLSNISLAELQIVIEELKEKRDMMVKETVEKIQFEMLKDQLEDITGFDFD